MRHDRVGRCRVTVVGLLAVAAASCGGGSPATTAGDDATATSATAGAATTAPARADRTVVELVDCHQFGTNTGIDPAAARRHVPEGHELYLDGQGNARFAFVAKECADVVVDGEPQGTAHFTTAWIRITGPDETRTFPGGVPTMGPTDYFHPELFHTDNDRFAAAMARFGMPMTRADEMTFGPATPGPQTGSAADTQMEPPLRYRWSVDNVNRFPSTTGGIVHVLEGRDDEGRPLTYDIACLAAGGFAGNAATLEVDAGSPFADIIGTGFAGPGNGPDLDCTITITRG
ncbi:MAG: hypothetical protein R2726_06870 [Acidimicrobiales bacterium]